MPQSLLRQLDLFRPEVEWDNDFRLSCDVTGGGSMPREIDHRTAREVLYA
jgi:hypothetical protein